MRGNYTVRLATPEDASCLVTLVERCYVGTYTHAAALDPQRVAEEIEEGRSFIAIAESPEGKAVGTAALEIVTPRAATYGRVVVDHDHRGRRIMQRMGVLLVKEMAPASGVAYVHSSVVTNHPFAQRHCVKLDGVLSGLLLGLYPDDLEMRGIGGVSEPVSAAQVVFCLEQAHTSRSLQLRGRDLRRARKVLDAFEIPSSRRQGDHAPRLSWSETEVPSLGLRHMKPLEGQAEEPELSGCFDARLVWVDVPATALGAQQVLDRLRERGFCYGAYLLGLGADGSDVIRMQRYQGDLLSEESMALAEPYAELSHDLFAEYQQTLVLGA